MSVNGRISICTVGGRLEAIVRPQLIIDNDLGQSMTINILRAITASTLTAIVPPSMTALIALLDNVPAGTPSCPSDQPTKIAGLA